MTFIRNFGKENWIVEKLDVIYSKELKTVEKVLSGVVLPLCGSNILEMPYFENLKE